MYTHRNLQKNNKVFESLRDFISEKQLKYFRFYIKKACNFRKFYLLPRIHKRMFNIPGRPTISNCGTPAESF